MNSANPSTTTRQSWAEWLLIITFAGLLAMPTLDFFTGLDISPPPDENRLPAPPPKLKAWNFTALQQFITGSEAYFNDHFGCRKRLIRWSQHWRSGWFNDQSGHKVVKGQNGWLFLGEYQMINHYLGLLRFTDAELHDWQKLLEKRRDWLAARGIKYVFVVPPDKHSVYSEELPDWLQQAAPANNRETKLDQFVRYMKEHSTVDVIDLRPALLAAKAKAPVYLKNDSHWNMFGSFIGAEVVLDHLSKQLPDLRPLRPDDYAWTSTPNTNGDLLRFIGEERSEKNFVEVKPKAGLPTLKDTVSEDVVSTWGTHKPGAVVENPALPEGTLVVFGDSFCHGWHPYLGSRFRKTFFFGENREFNQQVILENRPQVVINEMLERFLNVYDPREIMAHDDLP